MEKARLPTRWIVPLSSVVCSVLIIGTTIVRLNATGLASFPGHADRAFYFTTARNLVSGAGTDINYLWHFLVHHPDLTHYAFDYWLPGGAVANALGMLILGSEVSSALVVSIVGSMALAATTYFAARTAGLAATYSSVVAAVVIVLTPVTKWAMQPEPLLVYSSAAVFAIALISRARTSSVMWALAGACIGIAHATRSEGLIILAVAAWCAVRWNPSVKGKARSLGMLLIPYVLVMSPVFVLNQINLGKPLPTVMTRFLALTEYEDVFSANPLPWPSFGQAIAVRANNAVEMALRFLVEMGPESVLVLLSLVVMTLITRKAIPDDPRNRQFLGVAGLYVLGVFLVCGILVPAATAGGTWEKSFSSWIPLTAIWLACAVREMPRHHKSLVFVLVGLLVITGTLRLDDVSRNHIEQNNEVASALDNLEPALHLEDSCLNQELVLMTRDPWEYSEYTGRRSVQIPNDNLATVMEVAQRYGATHLLLPAPRDELMTQRDALVEQTGFVAVPTSSEFDLLRFPGVAVANGCG